MRRRASIGLVLVLLAVPHGRAGGAPDEGASTPAEVADAVESAVAAGDLPLLRALAADAQIDPWLVVEELCARGRGETASAFAEATEGPAVADLPAYAARRRTAAVDEREHEVTQAVSAALQAKDWQGALDAAGAEAETLDTVDRIRIAAGRAQALWALGRRPESARVLEAAGRAASALGWRTRAASLLHLLGRRALESRDASGAREAFLRETPIREALGDDHELAITLLHVGEASLRLRDFEASLRAFERVAALAGPLHELRLAYDATLRVAYSQENLGHPAEAVSGYERAAEIATRLGDASLEASALNSLGAVEQERGRNEAAIEAFHRALELRKSAGDQRGVAQTFHNLGVAQDALGDLGSARESFQRSLEISNALGDVRGQARDILSVSTVEQRVGKTEEAVKGIRRALEIVETLKDAPYRAFILQNLGVALASDDRHEEALTEYGRALELYEARGDLRGVAIVQEGRAAVLGALGRYEDALAACRTSLEAAERFGDRSLISQALSTTGNLHREFGDFAGAMEFLRRALDLAVASADRTSIGRAYSALGIVQSALGQHAAALESQQRALAEAEASGSLRSVGAMLLSVGALQDEVGQHEKALASYRRAVQISESVGDRAGVAAVTRNIGLFHLESGEAEEALAALEKAREIDRELGDQAVVAQSTHDIGLIQARIGHADLALRSYTHAYEMAQSIGAADTQARACRSLAELHLRAGEPGEAMTWARRGVRLVTDMFGRLAEEEGPRARERYEGVFDLGAWSAARTGSVEDLLWFLEEGRAGTLRESLGSRSALEAATVPPELRQSLNAARHAERRALQQYRSAQAEGELKAVRAARKSWEEAVATSSARYADVQRQAKLAADVTLAEPDTLSTVQGNLEPGDALVLYAVTDTVYVALVVGASSARIVTLGDASAIDAAARTLLAGGDGVDPAGAPMLRQLLVTSLALPDDAQRVLISPVGPLAYVPFRLLMPEKDLVFVPSATLLGILRRTGGERGEGVLAFGDPDYESRVDDTALHLRGGAATRLPPLPGTREEVQAIADVSIVGREATEKAVARAVSQRSRWRAVHFACHGLVDPQRPMLSALALAADGEDDGFLTALEVLRMRIPADLVVLSACETARGEVLRTEGMLGLMRAFMHAGASRVLCSLWKVDDEATRALMTKFYALWHPAEGTGRDAARALREAQAYVAAQERWQHPRYWAAWVLWGLPE